MILYAVYLFELPSRKACGFVQAFRDRWSTLGKIPGHIHTDLLEDSFHSRLLSRFLSISFFTSLEAMQRAERSTEMQTFLRWGRGETTLCVELGTFSFPPWPDSDKERQNVGAGMMRA